jgi:ferredoxin-NADP reductase/MOSC domain-containing protein YiiM
VGRLVSVNVGLPQDVSWRGRSVHTGIWKTPVDGPRLVRTLNIDGDGQGDLGGHGGPHRAVLVYQSDSLRYWSQVLGRDDLAPGSFGENFTVDGLPDDEVCIGDRLAIGAALFEVSQPRVTCYRVGMRLEEPQLPALLVSHRRPGFYLRVLREGEVRAGDNIVLVEDAGQAARSDRMTVAEVDGLLYLPSHGAADVRRALGIEALSPGWKGSFAALVEQAERPGAGGNAGLTGPVPAKPAWSGFRSMTVLGLDRETSSVTSLRLAAADGSSLPTPLPGQFVTLRLAAPEGGTVSRSYSISAPTDGSTYRVSVKREPGGAAGALVHDLAVGATVDVAAPRGSFTLDDGDAPVLLLSAGIGVTPVLAMLHALVQRSHQAPVWWVHVARNSSEHAFADEARDLLARLPTPRSVIAYTAPLPGDVPGVSYTHQGRPEPALLSELGLPSGVQVYLCGPASFTDEMTCTLTGLDVPAHDVHTELFTPRPALTPGISSAPTVRPHPPEGPAGTGPTVSFARSGVALAWDTRFGNLLELAEACDVPVRWSCRTGVCHNCEVGLVSGSVDYQPEPVEDPAEGNVLICSATPYDEVTLDL